MLALLALFALGVFAGQHVHVNEPFEEIESARVSANNRGARDRAPRVGREARVIFLLCCVVVFAVCEAWEVAPTRCDGRWRGARVACVPRRC